MPQQGRAEEAARGSHTSFCSTRTNLQLPAAPASPGTPGAAPQPGHTGSRPGWERAEHLRRTARALPCPPAGPPGSARAWPGRAMQEPAPGGRALRRRRDPNLSPSARPSPGASSCAAGGECLPPSRHASRGRCFGSAGRRPGKPGVTRPAIGWRCPAGQWQAPSQPHSRPAASGAILPRRRGASGPGHAALPGLGGVHPRRREALPRRPHEGGTARPGGQDARPGCGSGALEAATAARGSAGAAGGVGLGGSLVTARGRQESQNYRID